MKLLVWPPAGTPVTAQVIFGHPASGDWTSFRAEALELAAHGVRSCLLQFARGPGSLRSGAAEARYRQNCVDKILDAAEALSRSSDAPITYVGKNLGAFLGGLAAARESRIRRFVLAAGVPDLTRFYLSSRHPVAVGARKGVSKDQLREFERATAHLNPVAVLPQAVGREIRFQWGRRDRWVPKSEALRCVKAAPSNSASRFYDDDHAFRSLQARRDRKELILAPVAPGRELGP